MEIVIGCLVAAVLLVLVVLCALLTWRFLQLRDRVDRQQLRLDEQDAMVQILSNQSSQVQYRLMALVGAVRRHDEERVVTVLDDLLVLLRDNPAPLPAEEV